jgi:acyl carrier protein
MNKMVIKKQVVSVIAETFSISESKLNQNTHKNEIKNWDSLGQLKLVMDLEEKFSVRFTMQETQKLDRISNIINIISKKII